MGISAGAVAFKLAYQISPIMFSGGIASSIPGQLLPLLAISGAIKFANGLLSPGTTVPDLDSYFAYFQPLAGGTLIDQQIGMYPFANQAVAANATIQQPLTISMLMICPVGAGGGYASRLAIMSSIQSAFDQHNKAGGSYSVATPSFIYPNCTMTAMTDVSSTATKQVQNTYKLDFLKPLISMQDAAQAYNAQMGKIAANVPSAGTAPFSNIPAPVGPIPGAGPYQGPAYTGVG